MVGLIVLETLAFSRDCFGGVYSESLELEELELLVELVLELELLLRELGGGDGLLSRFLLVLLGFIGLVVVEGVGMLFSMSLPSGVDKMVGMSRSAGFLDLPAVEEALGFFLINFRG